MSIEVAPPSVGTPLASSPEFSSQDLRNGGRMMPFDVLTLSQVANYLQLPETTILEEVNAGRLPGRCIAGQWRFILVALTDWLRETEDTSYVKRKPLRSNESSSSDEETESLLAEIRASRRNLGTVGDWYPDEGAE